MRSGLAVVSAAWTILAPAAGGAQGSAPSHGVMSHGEVLFENRCARCHGLGGDGSDGLAPRLVGVFGRAVAIQSDFPYSPALKARGGDWTAETLDAYIADPQAFAPGADMDVASPDPAERAALVDYLRTLR